MIHPCTCPHKDQDDIYGKGRRLFNEGAKNKSGGQLMKCTVCGTKIPVPNNGQ